MTATKLKQTVHAKTKSNSKVSSNRILNYLKAQALKGFETKSTATFFLLSGKTKLQIPKEKILSLIEMLEQEPNKNKTVLTTQEVADLLNVSRPFVIKLIEQKQLPLAFKAGNQRRIFQKDALELKAKMRSQQSEALRKLTDESEDLGLDF